MEDFGNIVYIIAAIGWFLWKTFKKSDGASAGKPSKTPSGDAGNRQERPTTFESLEEMIREQLGEQKQPELEPKAVPVPVQRDNRSKFLSSDLTHSHLSENYKMSVTEMKSHRVQRQVQPSKVKEEYQETLMDQILPNGFDLRSAVVLDAILKRPYN